MADLPICAKLRETAYSTSITFNYPPEQTDEWEAADTISALYGALEAMRHRWELYTGGRGGAGHTDDKLMDMADAALAQARGSIPLEGSPK